MGLVIQQHSPALQVRPPNTQRCRERLLRFTTSEGIHWRPCKPPGKNPERFEVAVGFGDFASSTSTLANPPLLNLASRTYRHKVRLLRLTREGAQARITERQDLHVSRFAIRDGRAGILMNARGEVYIP